MFVIKFIFKWLFRLIVGFIVLSILTVFIYKFVNPPVTPIMIVRVFEYMFDGEFIGIHKEWKSFDEISPNIYKAVISAEDARFMSHNGIDWKAVDAAKKYNEIHEGVKKRGASTITMQTAKNTFLLHTRVYARKAFEVYFTYLIENIWGKRRIMEVYVNIVEFGKGIYGVEEASQTYFHKSSSDLTPQEAAALAAVLPNPRLWCPAKPTKYLNGRISFIMGRMNSVAIPKNSTPTLRKRKRDRD